MPDIVFRTARIVALIFLVNGCGGGSDGAADDAADGGNGAAGEAGAPIADLTGVWRITERGVSNCDGQETYAYGPSEISITQDGNALTVETPAGTFNGSINGNRAGWTGSYPSGAGTTTITSMDLTVAADGDAFSGSAEWRWSDGSDACSGTSQAINANRMKAAEPEPEPKPKPEPDPVPQAPSGLSGMSTSPSSVRLVWNDNAGNERGYKVERRRSGASDSGFTQVALLSANATGYTDTGLDALTAYDYRVRAYNATGNSAYSNVFTVTTLAPPAPAPLPPSNLSAAASSTSSIALRWDDNSTNETSFRIERSTRADGGFSEVASPGADATAYEDTGLASATQYFYRVRARNGTGNSAYSNVASATTRAQEVAPERPEDLEASPLSSSRIGLRWKDRSGDETGFKIERSRSRDGGFSQVGTTPAGVAEFIDSGLEPGTRYFYRVRATRDGLDSDYSNIADARTFRLGRDDDDGEEGDDEDDD